MTNRVLFGNLGGGAYGLKVSKAGVDVVTAADKDLIFHSDWAGHSRIHQRGTLAWNSSVSFPSLGFIPVTFFLVRVSGSDYRTGYAEAGGGGGGGGFTSFLVGYPYVTVQDGLLKNNIVANASATPTIYYLITNMRAV